MSEGMADIPEESNVDTESDGARLGKYEDFSDGDRDKDYDESSMILRLQKSPSQSKNKMMKILKMTWSCLRLLVKERKR